MEELKITREIEFPSGTKNIVLISDVHFGIRNFSIEWIDNTVDYFKNFLIPKMRGIDGRVLVIAGDFFDNRQAMDIGLMNVAMDIMYALSRECPVYVLVGNHDIYKRNGTEINSLRIFENMPGVTVIDVPTIVSGGRGRFLMMPWVGDSVREVKCLKDNEGRYDSAILHSEISGFKYDNDIKIIDGLNLSTISKSKIIWSGHIHKRQQVGNVCYVGSPFQLRRVDAGNDRGFYVIDIERMESRFVKNDYSPIFIRFRLDEMVELTMFQLRPIVNNNYVDIIIKQKDVNVLDVTRLSDVLKECGIRKMELVVDDIDDQIASGMESVRPIEDIMNIPNMVRESIENTSGLSMEEKKDIMEMNDRYFEIAVADTMKIEDAEN